jgi:hypothetical protein
MTEDKEWVVVREGGCLGESGKSNVVSPAATKLEASQKARRMNASLSPGEKSYYKIKYKIERVK